jgi:hypothetical protein
MRRATRVRVAAGALALGLLALLPAPPALGADDLTYHDPNMDFASVEAVAVLPFENLTNSAHGAETVRDVFMTMLQATGSIYVVPPGEVSRGLTRLSLREPAAPSSEEVKQLAGIVGAQAVIVGTVSEYGELRSSGTAANVVSFSIRMIEADSGKVVFSASASEGGVSLKERMFGGGGRPMTDVTRRAVRKLLDRLFE